MNLVQIWSRRWPDLVGAAGAIAVALVYLVFSGFNTPESRAKRAISLGERYLLEEKYDQSVVQFTNAIEIAQSEPTIAYLGEQARTGLENAAQAGAVAQVEAPGGDVQAAVTWLQTNRCEETSAGQLFVKALSLLEQLRDLCAAESYEEVFSLLADTAYRQTVAKMMNLDCAIRLLDPDAGRMTAIYRMEVDTRNFTGDGTAYVAAATAETAEAAGSTNYMAYYGGYDGEARSGQAVWLAYQNGNNYLAKGPWVNDRPNGEFETRSWQANLNATVTYRIITGQVEDGLWDGTVSWRFERGGESDAYEPSFSQGIWQILREEDGLSIAADNGDGKRLVVTEPDKTNGIAGYAEVA